MRPERCRSRHRRVRSAAGDRPDLARFVMGRDHHNSFWVLAMHEFSDRAGPVVRPKLFFRPKLRGEVSRRPALAMVPSTSAPPHLRQIDGPAIGAGDADRPARPFARLLRGVVAALAQRGEVSRAEEQPTVAAMALDVIDDRRRGVTASRGADATGRLPLKLEHPQLPPLCGLVPGTPRLLPCSRRIMLATSLPFRSGASGNVTRRTAGHDGSPITGGTGQTAGTPARVRRGPDADQKRKKTSFRNALEATTGGGCALDVANRRTMANLFAPVREGPTGERTRTTPYKGVFGVRLPCSPHAARHAY